VSYKVSLDVSHQMSLLCPTR